MDGMFEKEGCGQLARIPLAAAFPVLLSVEIRR